MTNNRHRYRNTYFRGVETSSTQVCVHCGQLRQPGSRFVETIYTVDGKDSLKSGPCNGSPDKEKAVYEKYFAGQEDGSNGKA